MAPPFFVLIQPCYDLMITCARYNLCPAEFLSLCHEKAFILIRKGDGASPILFSPSFSLLPHKPICVQITLSTDPETKTTDNTLVPNNYSVTLECKMVNNFQRRVAGYTRKEKAGKHWEALWSHCTPNIL